MSHSIIRILVYAGILIVSVTARAAPTLVDDFNGGTIAFPQWSNFAGTESAFEFLAEVDPVAENLMMRQVSDGSRFARVRINVLGTQTNVTALQATLVVVSADGRQGEAVARLDGIYYNAQSAAPLNFIGDIFMSVRIGDRGNGLEAWWEILESQDAGFETFTDTTGDIIPPGTLTFGTPYVTSIQYDGDRAFTVSVDGISTVAQGPPRTGPASFAIQRLAVSTEEGAGPSAIHATFDDVVLDRSGTVFEDFSTGIHIDSSKWAHRGGALITDGGRLQLRVNDDDVAQNGTETTDLFLTTRNPDFIEAKVAISSETALDAGVVGLARLTGFFYNERHDGTTSPYDGADGDVWGRIELRVQDGIMVADAYLESQLANYDTDQVRLPQQPFTTTLNFDTEYRLSLRRTATHVIFGLNDETILHTIATPTFPPSSGTTGSAGGYRRFLSRIEGSPTSDPAGAAGSMAMTVDDVSIEIVSPASGSNSDGNDGDGSVVVSNGGGALGAFVLILAGIYWRRRTFCLNTTRGLKTYFCRSKNITKEVGSTPG